jgi:predicted glycosyltransferase involved in capsule biosynthesis
MREKFKLTICTHTMNRLNHLKQTYIRNLDICKDLPNVDFVLLNFNCHQGTHQWARDNLLPYIESGQLNYFYENTAKHFHMSKAKNLAHRMATGDRLMNLDADNFLNLDTVNTLLSAFCEHNKKIACGKQYICGLLIVKQADFYAVNGYDESFVGWGYEEIDLYQRITRHRHYQRPDVQLLHGLQKIEHDHHARLENMDIANKWDPFMTNRLNALKSKDNIKNENYIAQEFHHYMVCQNFETKAIPAKRKASPRR